MFCVHVSTSYSRGFVEICPARKIIYRNVAGKIQEGFFQYDPTAMSWTQLSAAGSEAPVHRIGPGFTSAVGRIFIFGGDSLAGQDVLRVRLSR